MIKAILWWVAVSLAVLGGIWVAWVLGKNLWRWVRDWVVVVVPDKDDDGKPIRSFNPSWQKGNRLWFLLRVVLIVVGMLSIGVGIGAYMSWRSR